MNSCVKKLNADCATLLCMRSAFILSVVCLTLLLVGCSKTEGVVDILAPSSNLGTDTATVIQCSFGSFMYVKPIQKNDGSEEIRYEVIPEDEPFSFSIVKHEDGSATMKGNGGESDLLIAKNDEQSMVFLEQSGLGHIFTYTIFPDREIGIMTKANEAFGAIYSLVGVGRCW